MAKWYTHIGFYAEQRRGAMLHKDDKFYAEVFMLPGASLQLSYQEIMALDAYLQKDKSKGLSLKTLADAPTECPVVLGDGKKVTDDCFPSAKDAGPRMGWFAPTHASTPTMHTVPVPIMNVSHVFPNGFSPTTPRPRAAGFSYNSPKSFAKTPAPAPPLIADVDRAEAEVYSESDSD